MITVGKNETYNRENLVRPFLVHQILGPKPPPPLPPPAQKKPCLAPSHCGIPPAFVSCLLPLLPPPPPHTRRHDVSVWDSSYSARADRRSWRSVTSFLKRLFTGSRPAATRAPTMRAAVAHYVVGGTTCQGYVMYDAARCTATSPCPAVVIIPDLNGLTQDERDEAYRVASMGYVAFVADTHGLGTPVGTQQVWPDQCCPHEGVPSPLQTRRSREVGASRFSRSHRQYKRSRMAQRSSPPPLLPATLGVGSVNFHTLDFGGAFFTWSYCVLCVLSDTWFLRCVVIICYVKEADLGMMAFVAYFALRFSEQRTMSFRTCHAQCNAQATPLSKQH